MTVPVDHPSATAATSPVSRQLLGGPHDLFSSGDPPVVPLGSPTSSFPDPTRVAASDGRGTMTALGAASFTVTWVTSATLQ
jgi:hypothetical protein